MKKYIYIYTIFIFFVVESFAELHIKKNIDAQLILNMKKYHVEFEDSFDATVWESIKNNHDIMLFEKIYNVRNFSQQRLQAQNYIPRIIHQIWIGSPFPERYKDLAQSWIDHHPGWQYKLWTDDEVKELEMINREAYESSKNFGEKSDILRLEILLQQGGIYVDVDFECVKNFEIFIRNYDFFCGLEPFTFEPIRTSNALMGACKNHTIIRKYIDEIKEDYLKTESTITDILRKTGPIRLTKILRQYLMESQKAVVMPPSYFCPWQKLEISTNLLGPKESIRPETFGIHYWTSSYIPKLLEQPHLILHAKKLLMQSLVSLKKQAVFAFRC